jgi:lysophospholipase L1-like esterase
LALFGAIHTSEASAEDIPAPLRDVRRIVFLGDSITQGGDYVTDFDCWLVSKGMNIEVLNLGLASETAADLTKSENEGHKTSFGFARPAVGERLDRVLAATTPDILFACYGMNDGGSLSPDEDGTHRFAVAITRLRDAALKAGVRRVVLCTPPVQDAKGDASRGTHDENLTRYSTWLVSKKTEGWDVVDIHGPMRKILDERRSKDPAFTLASDGVHPGREGHWIMATAILTQLCGANLEGVSSAEQLFQTDGKKVRDLVHERMSTCFDAWMTKIGHKRPGVAGAPGSTPGPSVSEANSKAGEIAKQIAKVCGR